MYKVSKAELTLIFFLMITMTAGGYYAFDFPQLFEDEIINWFGVTSLEVEWLYSIYAFPNFFTLLFGTLAFNFIGLGMGITLTTGFITAGTVITYFAFEDKSYITLVIARGVYGLGNELAITAQYTIAERWFAGRMLSFAQGMCRTVSFLMTFLSFYLGPQMLIKTKSMDLPLLIYMIMAIFGFIGSLIYAILEKIWKNRQVKKEAEEAEAKETRSNERSFGKEGDNFTFGMIRYLSPLYWLLSITFGIGSMCYLMFISFSTDCLVHRFGYSYADAKNYLSFVSIISMFSMPVLSALVGKFGRKGFVLLSSFVVSITNFSLMLTYPKEPGNYIYVIVVLTSFTYSIFVATVWPSMTISVPTKATAIALGLALTMQNICNTLLPSYFGYVTQPRTPEAYDKAIFGMLIVSCVAATLAIIVIVVDFRTGQKLNLPDNDKRVLEQREKMGDKLKLLMKEKKLKSKKGTSNSEYRSIGQTTRKTGDDEIVNQ